jgi:predicted amidohydrolase
MRVALAQLSSPLEEPVAERIARVSEVVRGIRGADLVMLPELWASGYFAFDRYEELAEAAGGDLVRRMGELAREIGTHLHLGSVLERDPDGRLYNAALLLGPDGQELLHYRKIHVFGYESLESTLLTAGTRADVAATPLGSIGVTTCYDLRFPELYRVLVDRGAELVAVPAAWPMARLEHWRLFTRVRAVENQVFLLACNAAGSQGDVELAGHSVVVDPWGRVVAEAGADEEVLVADIDTDEVLSTRTEFPVLRDRLLTVPFSLA